MNFEEIVKELRSGHPIRRKSWKEHSHIKLTTIIIPEGEEVTCIKGYRHEAVYFSYNADIIISDDWMVYGSEDVIDFPSAIKMLKKKFKVKLKCWPKLTYIELDRENNLIMYMLSEHTYHPTFDDFSAIDWEIME
ncbi:MAG TPA: hypothetical protein VKR58_09990 [Aquella sp.]|nr:hypothetical protein [Aquella sp.]